MNTMDEVNFNGNAEYEDDFEKDLDWLINEDTESGTEEQNSNKNEELNDFKEDTVNLTGEENGGEKTEIDHLHSESSTDSMHLLKTVTEYGENDLDDEEAKRYIAEKIEEANKLLEMETVDESRQRKLKFKDNLVDMEIPPMEYSENTKNESGDEDVVDSISHLHVSNISEQENDHLDDNASSEGDQKNGKVLVERDGKFELVNICDIENQHFLPPIKSSDNGIETSNTLGKSSQSFEEPLGLYQKDNVFSGVYVPQPPNQPKTRPNSSINFRKPTSKIKSTRRVQSAGSTSKNTTFTLSAEQKDLLKKLQQKQEKLRKEEEERKKQEEEQKKIENEIAFKAWLHKKKGQQTEEKKIQQAKELEKLETTNSDDEDRDPKEAFNLWLQKKEKERLREKRVEEQKRQEVNAYLPKRQETEKAFKQWLRRKRSEKYAEEQAAKERSRQLLIEARRTKQIQNLLYSISDSKTFYLGHYS
ncbi:coiled-coil domain-containing protein 181 [Bombina bombina]|uniref:coiled-coil domain-containing protein 181 n=1 Tax=Bombina bombina TaxID=8345 RepID=UPI00235ADADD|nr:coiled-coil domain-containing protein 181 [Bombina bombina]